MELIERFERAEAELMWQLGAVPAAARDVLGISRTRVGGGIAVAVANDPTGFWSKAQGFDGPVTGELIGAVVEFTRAAGGTAMNFHLPAEALPADWDRIEADYGLTTGPVNVKAVREAGPVAPVPTDLRVGVVGPEELSSWAALQVEVFELPAGVGFEEMLAGFAELPGCTAYGAWDGDKLVATGALYLAGEVGELVSGATLPEYRGRGAQSALLARRTEDAYAAGCRWTASETTKPGPGERVQSLANMERTGYKVLYDRPVHVWTA